MKVFLSYIRLVRPFNLIMIVFTLYMVRMFFLLPTVDSHPQIYLPVSEITYALFSLSFVLIAAGGYIINDYYDIEIDKVNKPGRVVIGNDIAPRSALTTYWILNICSLVTGFVSCYLAGVPLLGSLFLFYLVGLWLYSYKLKSTFLFGNILIGIFLALVTLGGTYIILYAKPATIVFTREENVIIWKLMGAISVFASLSTLIREIVKDAEDMEGDIIAGCRTMPIVIGVKTTKWIVFFLILVLNGLLGYVQYQCMFLGKYPFIYFLVFLELPFIIILYKLLKASEPNSFHKISAWLKWLMLTGIIYVFALALEGYSIYLFFDSIFNK